VIFVRFRLSTLLIFVTLCCITLGVAGFAANRIQRQRHLLTYLNSKYGNRPWAGARYDHEAEIGELHYRSLYDDLFHCLVEVQFFQAFEDFDETALLLSRVPSIETIRVDESDLTDAGIRHLCRLKRLRSLDIPWSSISDKGLMELASLPSLKRLDIRASDKDITIEAVARFRRQRLDVELLEDASLTEADVSRAKAIESGADLDERARD